MKWLHHHGIKIGLAKGSLEMGGEEWPTVWFEPVGLKIPALSHNNNNNIISNGKCVFRPKPLGAHSPRRPFAHIGCDVDATRALQGPAKGWRRNGGGMEKYGGVGKTKDKLSAHDDDNNNTRIRGGRPKVWGEDSAAPLLEHQRGTSSRHKRKSNSACAFLPKRPSTNTHKII